MRNIDESLAANVCVGVEERWLRVSWGPFLCVCDWVPVCKSWVCADPAADCQREATERPSCCGINSGRGHTERLCV
jgi:hypothetical protein